MKVLKYAVILLLGLSMTFMVSCTKDPNNGGNGGNNGGGSNNHAYVDLGLPSGTLWATCNVGADTPEGYGDYFAWGETTPKPSYTEENYKFYIYDPVDSVYKITKYCRRAEYGYNGFVDNLIILEAIDDAATANWGEGWHIPSEVQWNELLQYTTRQVSYQNNVRGLTLTGINNNSIFLPLPNDGNVKFYWTSTLSGNYSAVDFESPALDGEGREYGLLVRPVRSNQ